MAMKYLKKIKAKFQFLYRQNKFLNPKLYRLLCNSLIQPHFDYACVSWYPLVSKKIVQVTQNTFINFCLKLNSRHHIGDKEFKDINYVNELFVPSRNIYKIRSHMALLIHLRHPFCSSGNNLSLSRWSYSSSLSILVNIFHIRGKHVLGLKLVISLSLFLSFIVSAVLPMANQSSVSFISKHNYNCVAILSWQDVNME